MVETSCKETRKKPSRFIDTNTSKLDSLLLEFHSYKPMKWMELNEGNGRASRGSILISLLSLENEIWCHKFEIRSEDVWWRGWAFKWHLRSSSSMGWSKEKEKHQGRQLNGRLQTSPDSNSKLATSFFSGDGRGHSKNLRFGAKQNRNVGLLLLISFHTYAEISHFKIFICILYCLALLSVRKKRRKTREEKIES